MPERTFTICGQTVTGARHICCFFDSKEQQDAVFIPYLKQGLQCGEHVVCILPHSRQSVLTERMQRAGVDLLSARRTHQLNLLTEDETYVKGGIFASQRMKEMLRQVLEAARNGPYPYVRTLGEMEWALRNLPGTDDLMDYECAVNELLSEYDCTLACAYDVTKFSGRVLMDALSTHSHVVLDGTVHSNPYFLPPAEFRRQLALRRSGPGPILRAPPDTVAA
jgi:hypothetical protein